MSIYGRLGRISKPCIVARRIFRLSKAWPKEERYVLTDQLRRFSRSVFANTTEAWRKRRYPKHFINKLSDADTEAADTQSWLDFALDCEYTQQADYESLNAEYEHIIGGLVKMMASPDK